MGFFFLTTLSTVNHASIDNVYATMFCFYMHGFLDGNVMPSNFELQSHSYQPVKNKHSFVNYRYIEYTCFIMLTII